MLVTTNCALKFYWISFAFTD